MPYSVKVNFGQNLSLEVVGDDVAVVAALLNESTKKFLLVKRNNEPEKDKFCCTGGRVLKGEDLYKAMCRKVTEELGMKIKEGKLVLFGVTNTEFKNSIYSSVGSHTTNVSFLYIVNQESDLKIKLGGVESGEVQWKAGEEKEVVEFVRLTIKKLKQNIDANVDFNALYVNFRQ